MREHKEKCLKVKRKLKDPKWTKDEARAVLLGDQWFQGRTGMNDNATPTLTQGTPGYYRRR